MNTNTPVMHPVFFNRPPNGKAITPQPDSIVVILAEQSASNKLGLLCPKTALSSAAMTSIHNIAADQKFTGAKDKTLVIPSPAGLKAKKLIIFGVGNAEAELNLDGIDTNAKIEALGAKIADAVHGERGDLAKIDFVAPHVSAKSAHLVAGMVLRSYNFSLKQEKKPTPQLFVSHFQAGLFETYETLAPTIDAVCRARDLVNLPTNLMGTQDMARAAHAFASDLKLEIFDERALRDLDMGGMLAVAQGAKSVNPPIMVVMSHYSFTKNAPTLALIGKGVVYDTGGLGIKPVEGMAEMKIDMGGAAAVFGAMGLISRMKLPFHVVGIAGLVENSISEQSYRNGDVITMKSGQTVLVNHTDAEGRLVLADCATYAEKHLRANAVASIATLTGAAIVALHNQMAAGFSDSDKFYAAIEAASQSSGDTVWRMPLHPSFDKLIDGDQTDMKNMGGRQGGASIGAHFIKRHLGKQTVFAHFDIAGPVEASAPWHVHPKGATGFGVRLLADMVAQLAKSPHALTRGK